MFSFSCLTRKRNNIFIDVLTYTYNSKDQLHSVSDRGTSDGYVPVSGSSRGYWYYPNGNLWYDPSKKIEVSYNHLNLPNLIAFDNNDYITYAYTASGVKLRKTITTWKTATGGVTDYSGPFLYHDNQLSCIFTPAGRIIPITVTGNVLWKYEYNLTDHLGNVRVVFAAHSHGQPEVMQQTSYYPFGMTLQQQNFGGLNTNRNRLLYNSKELQDDELAGIRLDWYDYGARFYDPQLGRWHTVDLHAENYYHASPFAYVENNPILRIDPDGRDWYRHDETGAVKWREGSNAIDGYSNIGTHFTLDLGDGVSITYNQNTPETMVETVLNAEDWSSQINNPELGDCFAHSGIMVRASGAESLGGTHNNEPAANTVDYINTQVNQGISVRVHVARINVATGVAERGGNGVHWVAISFRTTNLQTGRTTSFGFFEPGTGIPHAGTSPDNRLNVGEGGSLTGSTAYRRDINYSVTAVRRNR